MPFIEIKDYEPVEIAPGAKARTPYGENIMLSYLELEEGSVVPPHQHPHEQAGMVLEGQAHFFVGEEDRVLGPGDMYCIPGGVTHRVVALDATVKALDVFHPVREDYL